MNVRVGGKDSLGNTHCAIYCSVKHGVRFQAKSWNVHHYICCFYFCEIS